MTRLHGMTRQPACAAPMNLQYMIEIITGMASLPHDAVPPRSRPAGATVVTF
jgi:hypothetical protein